LFRSLRDQLDRLCFFTDTVFGPGLFPAPLYGGVFGVDRLCFLTDTFFDGIGALLSGAQPRVTKLTFDSEEPHPGPKVNSPAPPRTSGGITVLDPKPRPYLLPMLFTDRQRTDASPRRHDETLAAFLERVAGAYWDRVRHVLESWLERVGEEARNDLVGRLLDSDHRQHRSAYWELYLHESFRRGGWEVVPHPDIGRGSRPDFQLHRDGDTVLVEAFVVSETSDADRAE
jgi:hypothetical protein